MKRCNLRIALLGICTIFSSVSVVEADVFNMPDGLTSLDFVTVGNPGNLPDTRYNEKGVGQVDYVYKIGMYEVTAGQYTEFLNAQAKSDPYGLYNENMWTEDQGCKIERLGDDGSYSYRIAADWANRPVNYVSYRDARRFANWLANGQGDADTETGAYSLGQSVVGLDPFPTPNVTYRLPSIDEFYKAAYYDPGKTGGAGYWDYATRTNTTPSNQLSTPDGGNNANFKGDDYTIGAPYYRTEVGAFSNSQSAYGTFDQNGNVYERTNYNFYYSGAFYNTVLGGSYLFGSVEMEANSNNFLPYDITEASVLGFRIVYVPEPNSLAILLIGSLTLLIWRYYSRNRLCK